VNWYPYRLMLRRRILDFYCFLFFVGLYSKKRMTARIEREKVRCIEDIFKMGPVFTEGKK
jgi:hypothetical protein